MRSLKQERIKIPTRSELNKELGDENDVGDHVFVIRQVQSTSLNASALNQDPHASHDTHIPPPMAPTMTIGKALLVLSHSKPNDWVSATLEDAQTPARDAFRSLDGHITSDSSVVFTILVCLLDQIFNEQQEKIGKQFTKCKPIDLFWWIFTRHPLSFQSAMCQLLSSPDHDSDIQLTTCSTVTLMTQHIITKLKNRIAVTTEESELRNYHAISRGFASLLPSLLIMLQNAGAATRLGVATGDCIFAIFSVLAETTSNSSATTISKAHSKGLIVEIASSGAGNLDTSEANALFIQNVPVLLNSLREMKKWYEKGRLLMSIALGDIESSLESLQESKHIVYAWTLISPFICLAPTKSRLQHLVTEISPQISSFQDTADAHYQVICVGLVCSSFPQKANMVSFLDEKSDVLIPALCQNLRYPACQSIVVHIFNQFMFDEKHSTLGNCIYELLPEVLDATVEMKKDLIDFIAETITRKDQFHQQKLVSSVIANLDCPTERKRNNSMDIIIAVIKQEPDSNTRILIQHTFISNILNETAFAKLNSAGIYQHLDVDYLMPKLVNLLQGDMASKMAANQMLVRLVCENRDPEYAFKALRHEACRDTAPNLRSPADIGNKNVSADERVANVLDIIPTISKKLDSSFWNTHLPSIVQYYLKNPQDTILVKFLAKLSNCIGEHLGPVLSVLMPILEDQPSLTEELLASASPDSEVTVKNLLFDRLAPLLVLKVVPYTLFDRFWERDRQDNAVLEQVSDLLIARMTQEFEFEEVRRVSAQVLSYFPPDVWAIKTLKMIQGALQSADYYTAKIGIFCWFNGLSIQAFELSVYVRSVVSIILSICSIATPPVTSQGPTEMQKLQFGAIDCLALLTKAAIIGRVGGTGSSVVSSEIRNKFSRFTEHHLPGFQDIPSLVRRLALPPFPLLAELHFEQEQQQISVFCGNVFNAVSNCIKACSSSASQVEEIARVFLIPLLEAVIVTTANPPLQKTYMLAILLIATNLKERLHVFEPQIATFLSSTLSSSSLQHQGLTLLQTSCAYCPSLVTPSVKHTLHTVSIYLQRARLWRL